MDREQALGLAAYLAGANLSVTAYARRRGLKLSTITSQAQRAGVRLAREIRRRRVAMVEDLSKKRPDWTLDRCAFEYGWSHLSAFLRARRSLQRWDAA